MKKNLSILVLVAFGLIVILCANCTNEQQEIAVSSVSLSESSLEVVEGETYQLTASIVPENATHKEVSWSSSDESVVSVINGIITANKVGSAIITVTTKEGNKTATCSVTVESSGLPKYLSFTAEKDGSTIALANYEGNTPNVEYSYNGIEWTNWDYSEISLSKDETIYLRGNNETGFSHFIEDSFTTVYSQFIMTGTIAASGSIMSLLYGESFEDKTSIPGHDCFYSLFSGCKSMITAPELPATKLSDYCYDSMFCDTGLTSAPELPATTLANGCYSGMFSSCSCLTVAPELPATTLAEYCYAAMFSNSGLVSAPELSAKNLAELCYYQMFSSCLNLTSAPKLPATTLANGCYSGMFSSCISLVTAPVLPATILTQSCYSSMFAGCSSLISAPELPATTLAYGCYSRMFRMCTNLTKAPELPATTLAYGCYNGMFSECTSLTSAPDLPARILAPVCYYQMFIGCENLKYIQMLATDISAEKCLYEWVLGVALSGTFIKDPAATWDVIGSSGVPKGWAGYYDHYSDSIPAAIDLGLSVKWASFNLGATKPEEYGDYYAWGEIDPYYLDGHALDNPCNDWMSGKSLGYGWESYLWCNGTYDSLTRYITLPSFGPLDNRRSLYLEDDAVRVRLGGHWRMPTQDELKELIDNCTWTWTTENGVNGYRVNGKEEGYTDKSIFFPASGYRGGVYHWAAGEIGLYWSSSLYSSLPSHASVLSIRKYDKIMNGESRCSGLSIRPVFFE